MIYIETGSTDVYYNFGLENYFTVEKRLPDTVFLFWRTTPTLMVGKYQNILEEINKPYADAHGIDLTGATVIDTLEPCCHVGSQPACTALILAHGIARVVVGSVDPNPIVAGKGLRILEEAGVEVVRAVMREECDAINRHFFHCITTGKPYIVDGRRRAGESDSEYAVRRREQYATYAAELAGTESDVPDESLTHINGPVQAVGADEVVIGGHRPLLLEAGALACTDPDEWLRELGKRKIDGLIVESDEAFERLSMACQKD